MAHETASSCIDLDQNSVDVLPLINESLLHHLNCSKTLNLTSHAIWVACLVQIEGTISAKVHTGVRGLALVVLLLLARGLLSRALGGFRDWDLLI